MLSTAIARLETTGPKAFIDSKKLEQVAKETDKLEPHLQACMHVLYINMLCELMCVCLCVMAGAHRHR